MEHELSENIQEFLESGEDNFKKQRWNAASSDFFKTISTSSDLLIYKEIKILPKNHNERFNLLRKYFQDIYKQTIELFNIYRKSYNLRLKKEDAEKLRKYAHEIRNKIN